MRSPCAHAAGVSVVFSHRAAPLTAGLRALPGGDFAHVACRCGEAFIGVPLWIGAAGVPIWVTRAIANAKGKK